MAWTKVELRQLLCDNCGAPGPIALSRVDAALEAVVTGWAYRGSPLRGTSFWRCPECNPAPSSNGTVRDKGTR